MSEEKQFQREIEKAEGNLSGKKKETGTTPANQIGCIWISFLETFCIKHSSPASPIWPTLSRRNTNLELLKILA
jgi:hypothetical protein